MVNALSPLSQGLILSEHLIILGAPNSHFKNEELLESLVYLSLGKRYAESGPEDLKCTREVPSADTLLRRLRIVDSENAHAMLVQANEEVIRKSRRRRVCRTPVLVAIDFSDDPF